MHEQQTEPITKCKPMHFEQGYANFFHHTQRDVNQCILNSVRVKGLGLGLGFMVRFRVRFRVRVRIKVRGRVSVTSELYEGSYCELG